MATGGRLHYWVSSCFILIAFLMFFLMLRGLCGGGNNQKQTVLYLAGAYVQPEHWPSINVSIQRCQRAVFTPHDPCSTPFGSKDFIPSFSSLRSEGSERKVSQGHVWD